MPPFEGEGVYCFTLVGRSVGPYVGPTVGPSVGRSVDHIFVQSITQQERQIVAKYARLTPTVYERTVPKPDIASKL